MNDLYTTEWNLLLNFFLPSVKLIEKHREGSKTIKHHDAPLTPLQRVLNSKKIPRAIKAQLRNLFDSLNPFALQHEVKQKIKHIHQLQSHVLVQSKKLILPQSLSSHSQSKVI